MESVNCYLPNCCTVLLGTSATTLCCANYSSSASSSSCITTTCSGLLFCRQPLSKPSLSRTQYNHCRRCYRRTAHPWNSHAGWLQCNNTSAGPLNGQHVSLHGCQTPAVSAAVSLALAARRRRAHEASAGCTPISQMSLHVTGLCRWRTSATRLLLASSFLTCL